MQVKPLSCLFNDLFVYMENQLAQLLGFPYLFSSRILPRSGAGTARFWHPQSASGSQGVPEVQEPAKSRGGAGD